MTEVAAGDTIVLDGPWESTIVQTIDNEWGDLALPPHAGPPPVQAWRMEHRDDVDDVGLAERWYDDAGTDGWTATRVTFGPHAVMIGPMPADACPPPLTPQQVAAAVDGASPLAEDWQVVEYSDRYGIEKDPGHFFSGPKGFVPEEFLHFAGLEPGMSVQLRAFVVVDEDASAHLAVGAPACKQVWWNGTELEADPGGYHMITPLRVQAGVNVLELRISRSHDPYSSAMFTAYPPRASWALVRDPASYRRPEWVRAGDDATGPTTFSHVFDVPFVPRAGALHVGGAGRISVSVNGTTIGGQGAGGYYDDAAAEMPWVVRYPLTNLRRGSNEIEIRLDGDASRRPVLVDAVADDGAGTHATLITDHTWTATTGAARSAVTVTRDQWFDPRHVVVRPRPHPLPRAGAIGGQLDEEGVVVRSRSAASMRSHVEWFRFPMPPGTTRVTLPVVGEARCFVDGHEHPVVDGVVDVDGHGSPWRVCTVRIDGPPGRSRGDLWRGPAIFDVGTGCIETGDWAAMGLAAYSGGVCYRRTIELAANARTVLSLGRVRGSAEVRLDGDLVGVRVCGPWTFELPRVSRTGQHTLEVLVFNTIAPLLDASTPTTCIYSPQVHSGLLGPVTLRAVEGDPRA